MSRQRLVKTKGSYVATEHLMSRQSFLELCRDMIFLCRDRGWSRQRDLMSRQSFLELCRDRVFLCRDIDLQDRKFSMSRHSVLCCDSEALRCVTTRLGAHDRDALSQQTSYNCHFFWPS